MQGILKNCCFPWTTTGETTEDGHAFCGKNLPFSRLNVGFCLRAPGGDRPEIYLCSGVFRTEELSGLGYLSGLSSSGKSKFGRLWNLRRPTWALPV